MKDAVDAIFPIMAATEFAEELFGDNDWLGVGDDYWVDNVLFSAFGDTSEDGFLISRAEADLILSVNPPKVKVQTKSKTLSDEIDFLLKTLIFSVEDERRRRVSHRATEQHTHSA